MPELIPAAPGSPDWLAARFTDHWAACDLCQDGLPCAEGDPLWEAMNEAAEAARAAEARPALKLTPYSRHGLIHGVYDQARPPLERRGFHEAYAGSWMYRRGFARGFLLAREAARHD